MSLRAEVYDEVHAGLLAAWSADGATASSIIPANDSGPKPSAPFVTVRVISVPGVATPDEKRETSGSDVLHTGRQVRDARVTLQAFGETAVGWLEALPLRLGWPSVMAVMVARETSAPRDLTEFLDTDFEARAEMEIGVYVDAVDDRSDALIPAATVELDGFDDTFTLPVE